MRKLNLTNYSRPDKSSHYKIHKMYSLGINDRILRFSQERQVIEFINGMNRFLNESLIDLNRYNAELYTIYRILWPYMDAYRDQEKQLRNEMVIIDDLFKRIISNTVGPNGNYFAFSFMISLTQGHIRICDIMNECLYRQRDDALRHQVRLITSRLNYLLNRLRRYPDMEISD